jgi:5-methylcytosine-specific restriction endonuclease McrA
VASLKACETLKCTYCETPLFGKPFHVDHKLPISRGGKHDIGNLCAACRPCNSSKCDKTPEEFAEYRRKLMLKPISV